MPTGEQEQEQLQHDEQRRQLVPLLALLSERRRQVLTLRYGLDPADARAHSREETARLLGLSPGAVYDAEQRAIATLRHAYRARVVGFTPTGVLTEALAQSSPPTGAAGKRPITAGHRQYHQRQHAEQQARLEAAFRSMQERGLPITSETLKNTAHVDHRAACVFVKQHLPQSAERARLRAIPVEQRLEEAFAQLVARGETLSITALKAAAHTDAPAARAFLRSRGVPRQWGGPSRKANRSASVPPETAHDAAGGAV